MKQLEIYDIRHKSFADISGGQKQRVLIARAMCASEKLIILDEPTNGLDPHIANQIYTILNDLKKKNNLTILMVSHDTYRALEYADKVIEMENGRVKFDGSIEEYKNGGDK
jgi:zinc transport system ATP-binding protein